METDCKSFRKTHSRLAFTLIELLVVIAVVTVLLGLLAPALSAFKHSGKKTGELNLARQLMTAYYTYATINQDSVLPGYPENPIVFDRNGRPFPGNVPAVVKKRYPLRLAPHLNGDFRSLFLHEQAELIERAQNENYDQYLYLSSLSPSLGLNTAWMGGDSEEYGSANSPLRRVLDYSKFYLQKLSQAIHPDRLLVFASARGMDPEYGTGRVVEGFHKVTSPYFSVATGYKWSGQFNEYESPDKYGFVSPRYDDHAVIGFMDGHAGLLSADQLKDMRHWANWATEPDWRLPRLPERPDETQPVQ